MGTLANISKHLALNAVWDQMNGTTKGYATVCKSDGTVLATLTYSTTAFAAATGGTKTANAITSGSIVATGTAAITKFYTGSDAAAGAGVLFYTGTAALSGGDFNFDNLSFVSGGTASQSSHIVGF